MTIAVKKIKIVTFMKLVTTRGYLRWVQHKTNLGYAKKFPPNFFLGTPSQRKEKKSEEEEKRHQ